MKPLKGCTTTGTTTEALRTEAREYGSAHRAMIERMVTGKKLGLWAFLFFLGKGLLWLAIPAAVYFRAC
jgi:hypothetical protein